MQSSKALKIIGVVVGLVIGMAFVFAVVGFLFNYPSFIAPVFVVAAFIVLVIWLSCSDHD